MTSTTSVLNLSDPEILWILGRPNFTCIQTANALRELGIVIPTKAEAEQAYVISFMLNCYKHFGEEWRVEGGKILSGVIPVPEWFFPTPKEIS